MKREIFFSLIFILVAFWSSGQKIATLEVELSEDPLGIQVPVSVELKAVTDLSPSDLNLIEISNGKKIAVPFQVDQAEDGKLHWMVTPGTGSNGKHVFVLMKGSPGKTGKVAATDKDGTLTLHYGDQNLLRYYHKTLYPPNRRNSLGSARDLQPLCQRARGRRLLTNTGNCAVFTRH